MPCPPLTQGILGLPHALTGHLQADPIGQGRAKLVAGKALVFPLILLWPPATAEVDHQGIPDLLLIDTRGSLAMLKNLLLRVQWKLWTMKGVGWRGVGRDSEE